MGLATTEATYRILDASANRAAEGLRTLEEFARFARDDAALAGELKSLRHRLAAAAGRLPRRLLLANRDAAGDVGASIGVPAEYARATPRDVIAAASSRTQQSLRCLEEYGKIVDPEFAREAERIRYGCYAACGPLELRVEPDRRRDKLATARLYALVDGGASVEALSETMRSLAGGGVDLFQLRDRGRDDRTLFERALAGAALARELDVLWIVNDRADLAVAADADGVHVGQEELPLAAARRVVGLDRLVGVSTHSVEQATAAERGGADYIGVGPVFAGSTKAFDTYVGPELLRDVSAAVTIPAFAIGGITADNLGQVLDAGFQRIAVTGAIRGADEPAGAAEALKARLVGSAEVDSRE